MSNSSDSEEFYDAEDITPSHGSRKNTGKSSGESRTHRASSEPDVSKHETRSKPADAFVQPSDLNVRKTPTGGRKKFKELRQKLQNDDENEAQVNVTPPNSQTSSVDGVYAASSKTSHPFRIIEQDTVSLQSISSVGRAVRLLGGAQSEVLITDVANSKKAASVSGLSSSSLDSGSTPSSSKGASQFPSNATISALPLLDSPKIPVAVVQKLQEPDVIASTKASTSVARVPQDSSSDCPVPPPVAPPRRKKKNRLALKKSATFEGADLASPASTIESLTREFEHSLDPGTSHHGRKSGDDSKSSSLKSGYSLDIKQALKGEFVVKPQDNDSLKAQKIYIGIGCKNEVDGASGKNKKVEVSNTAPRGSSNRSSVGHYSLGPHRGTHQHPLRPAARQRRRSAGDENMLRMMKVRTHTDSGKQLSDLEILEQVTVLNLDTGERVPLSVAEDKLPQCINPLSLHIMRLTSEYVSSSSMEKEKETDDEEDDEEDERGCGGVPKAEIPIVDEVGRARRKAEKIKKFVGYAVKKTMHKAKSIAHARHKEDTIDIVDAVHPGEQNIKLKASSSHKGPYEFEKVEHVQELKDEHEGPIWCMKFSCCGRLLATAGQDKVLRIWIVRDAYPFFQDMRTRYNAEKVSPTPSQESIESGSLIGASANVLNAPCSTSTNGTNQPEGVSAAPGKMTFMPRPFCTYSGHTSDLLDVSWSKNYFILSSSMDKTVRLWHISRKECLCCFQHIDFVTAIVFHPRDDRYFLSGSLDGKLRLWNIPDKKVAVWNEVEGNPKLITAANFCQNGKFAVVGTYDGRCIFYNTDQLKYHTQIHVRSSRGRNATGRKISGIEPMPGEDKILVTSNDSRIRLYDLRDLNVSCKYKGYVNMSSQIKASFSHDGKYIVSGSENRDIYIWKTCHDYAKFSSVRRDRNDFWEAIKAHNAVVTCAIFAPNPEGIIKMIEETCRNEEAVDDQDATAGESKVPDPVVEQHTKGCGGYVLISADFNGCIKVFVNKMKPKHSSLPVSAMA